MRLPEVAVTTHGTQLNLFPELPALVRPPRQLRLIGFELHLLSRDVAGLTNYRRQIDQCEARLATLQDEAKLTGQRLDAYDLVVNIEETHAKQIADKLRDTDELQRALDRKLADAIERYILGHSPSSQP